VTAAEEQRLLAVIRDHRWAALATQGADGPEASWVAFAVTPDGSFLLHLSRLAGHTRNLLQDSRAGLAISEQERDGSDPQLLARVSVQGRVQILERESPAYAAAAGFYRIRLPASAPLFDFPDFYIYSLVPEFVLRFLIWVLVHPLYRVRMRGHEHLPLEGPAILACNHVSYVDWLIVSGAVKRPLRYIVFPIVIHTLLMNDP
jgi:hypothetical protein